MEHFESKEKISLSLQEASEADIETLLEIERSVAGTHTYSALLTAEEQKGELEKGTVYLIKNGSAAVGYISYEQKGPEHIYISGLAVKPESQGKGFAREAMTRLIAEHPEAKRIDLVTHPDGPGLKLYESLDFVVEERKENYFGDGEPRLVLALTRE